VRVAIPYVKGSLKNIDKDGDGVPDHIQFKLINHIGSGSVYVSRVQVLVNGEDVTENTTFKIGDSPPRPAKAPGYVSSNYGDEILVEIKHNGKIGPGRHKIKLAVESSFGPYVLEFEDTI